MLTRPSQLSLTHFCELHGPTSIFCTQVLPFSCIHCYPETPSHARHDPSSTFLDAKNDTNTSPNAFLSPTPAVRRDSVVSTSSVATATPPSPSIENHPYFVRTHPQADTERLNRFGNTEGDTCESCRFTLPSEIDKKLPNGAPGSPKSDGRGRNGSPVLRSRELIHSCGLERSEFDEDAHDTHFQHSSPESVQSSYSSDSACHDHLITYLSLRGPPNPADYALLRRSSIRTLSCELLPRGLSSGPLSFGDAVAGFTIAYIFRLPDPKARGRRRSYALVALAGKDAGRAFRACPLIWRAFGGIASGIVAAAERFQEEEKNREEGAREAAKLGGRNYTPVSSFLIGRSVDPDGHPRRTLPAGQIRAKGLAEIVGNEYVFADMHRQFVVLLQQLGALLGGLPVSEDPVIYSTVNEDTSTQQEGHPHPTEKRITSSPGLDHTAEIDEGLAKLGLSSVQHQQSVVV